MARSKSVSSTRAAYLKSIYTSGFPGHSEYTEMLSQKRFEGLPSIFFGNLSQEGFAFTDLKNPPYNNLPTSEYLESIMGIQPERLGGLEVRAIRGFNIFFSMGGGAGLYIVARDGINFSFLDADFGSGTNETYPIIAEKRFYGQPLLLHHVLKKAFNSYSKNG
ncbi:MAG TPA: hypothetical protein VI564_06745 [Candidatus Nanoarchaeia archaeon]|nr:hypothetical protein [Candidatus Nanoarchaeia archaeon]